MDARDRKLKRVLAARTDPGTWFAQARHARGVALALTLLAPVVNGCEGTEPASPRSGAPNVGGGEGGEGGDAPSMAQAGAHGGKHGSVSMAGASDDSDFGGAAGGEASGGRADGASSGADGGRGASARGGTTSAGGTGLAAGTAGDANGGDVGGGEAGAAAGDANDSGQGGSAGEPPSDVDPLDGMVDPTQCTGCDPLAQCVRSYHAFRCTCPVGYDGGGTVCVPYDYGLIVRPTNGTCVAPAEHSPAPTIVAFSDAFPASATFQIPTAMAELPEAVGGGWLVTEIDGTLRYLPAGASASELVVDVRPTMDRNLPGGAAISRLAGSELGLVGVAVHPRFPYVPRIFVSYTLNRGTAEAPAWAIRLSSFEWSGVPLTDLDTETVVLEIGTPTVIHHAGTLGFDPQGMLLMSVGDGGPANFDPFGNAQNRASLLGKMLRIDVDRVDLDRGLPYSIPSDNPFAGGGGAPEVWAYGLRNPWKWSLDQRTGELWVGDVGYNTSEEIDRIEAGGNYGWPLVEGTLCMSSPGCEDPGLIAPVHEFRRTNQPASVIGGYVYHGSSIPELEGTYVFGDFALGTVSGLHRDGSAWELSPIGEYPRPMTSFAQDHDGEIYLLPFAFGAHIQKMVRNPIRAGEVPEHLSQTGCVAEADPRAPSDAMIPYDVNVPFWSDGAEKSRFFAIPDGQRIDVDADGDWQFPTGSVLMKHFRRGGRLIETRLLMHHGDGWAGYSYEWNADQTDATLLGVGKTEMLEDGPYTFPSRAACLRCHNEVAGYSLGLTTPELNRLEYYPSSHRLAPQLATLATVGLFAASPAAIDAFPALDDDAEPLDLRARAYLDVNCSYCHRPGGPTPVTMDLRFGVHLADTGTCAVPPARDDFGLVDAARIAPGSPASSLIAYRVHSDAGAQMPPLGRNRHDPTGAELVDDWIASLTGCGVEP